MSGLKEKTCLIVDDSRVVRQVVKQMMEKLGYETVEAEDGQKALDQFSGTRPALILLDWNMPVMTGIEFLKALRALGGDQPKVIFCTTENDMTHIQEAMQNGADEYIMKPFNADILETKLSQLGII